MHDNRDEGRVLQLIHNAGEVQGGEDSKDPLSLQVIFRKSDLYLVALLWKMICNLGDPISFCCTCLIHTAGQECDSFIKEERDMTHS